MSLTPDPGAGTDLKLADQPLFLRFLLSLIGASALALLAIPSLPSIRRAPRPMPTRALPQPAALAPVRSLEGTVLEVEGRRFVPGAFALSEELGAGSRNLRGVWIDPDHPGRGLRLGLVESRGEVMGMLRGLGEWSGASWVLGGDSSADFVLRNQELPVHVPELTRWRRARLHDGGAVSRQVEIDGAWRGTTLTLGPIGAGMSSGVGRWGLGADGVLRGALDLHVAGDRTRAYLLELVLVPGGVGLVGDGFVMGLGPARGAALQLAVAGTLDGDRLELRGEAEVHAAPARGSSPGPGQTGPVLLTFELERDRVTGLEAPVPSPHYSTLRDASTLALEGVARNFLPVGPLVLEESADGRGRIHGELQDAQDRARRFELDLLLIGRLSSSSLAASPASGHLRELALEAYVEQGGPCDPGTWTSYESVRGELTGKGAFEGVRLSVHSLAPMQIGFGANGVALEWGLLVPLQARVESAPESFPAGPLGAVLRGRLEH